ncbi:nitroreductase [Novosphingobium sp. PC22D]|uniref:nitroreductase/quinone reductase family protein n=1 Tax=Novosphingobium sp. PC22D TaxID=1962403 RepID=UPI000BF0DD6D|nr:nitroreductase/quinone reductase family protein [Novosphingobium sp. PC22D]PEQ13121.1 nitroreductase [Novosphingobium sp. PC22D]
MSDESSAVIREARRDWVTEHREMYLESGGAKGHIMDIRPVGGPFMGTHLMIKYTGRKSGKVFITPLCYADIGGEVVIVASKGGADEHPAWYLNIREQSEIEFQIATQAFRGTWREPEGAEREAVWDFMVKCYGFYGDYQKSTDRQIPLVMIQATEEIPVFKAEEATGMRSY